eukprot:7649607-Karenia_brevis.AAC.1
MPEALRNMAHHTADGRPLCYAFNIPHQGCTNAQPGGRCPRGFHLCCVPGCEQAHTMSNHQY